MKNYKYIKMTQEYFDEETLISLLQQQAKEGWMIKKIDHSYITFVECQPQTFKFQTDYVSITTEYQNIMKELGYKYVCALEGMNIYYNEDLNAQDLYNDNHTKVMSQLNFYKISKLANEVLWIFVCLIQLYTNSSNMLFKFYRHSLGMFYMRSFEYIVLGIWFLFLIDHVTNLIYLWSMRRYYLKQLDNKICERIHINYLKLYDYLNQINFLLLLMILPMLVVSIVGGNDLFRLSFIVGLCLFLIGVVVMLCKRHKFKHIIYAIAVVLFLGLGIGMYSMTYMHVPVDKLFYENKVDDIYIDHLDDILSSYRMIHTFHDEYYERCVVSVNELFSKEIFKEEIITLDAYARKVVADNDYFKYEDLIKTMSVIEDERIDEGFYNYKYAVFRKDNMVVSFRRADVPMEEVMNYYLSK